MRDFDDGLSDFSGKCFAAQMELRHERRHFGATQVREVEELVVGRRYRMRHETSDWGTFVVESQPYEDHHGPWVRVRLDNEVSPRELSLRDYNVVAYPGDRRPLWNPIHWLERVEE